MNRLGVLVAVFYPGFLVSFAKAPLGRLGASDTLDAYHGPDVDAVVTHGREFCLVRGELVPGRGLHRECLTPEETE